ncbi:MAG TPA: hypothetical protein VJP77_05635 [Planctomycetota bacterium]|nr:hypothetical protein [Planctomycetota bacterium]
MPTSAELAFRTRRYVPDAQDEGDTTGRRDASVVAALSEMSRDRPSILAASVNAGSVPVSEIAGWDASWSEVKESYWPVFSTDNPAIEDEPVRVLVETDDAGLESLRFPGAFPTSAQPALVRFTARWTVATLPEAYEEALVLLAASMYARALAGVKSNRLRVLPGGVTEFATEEQVARYTDLAATLYEAYRASMGLSVPIVGRARGVSVAGGAKPEEAAKK